MTEVELEALAGKVVEKLSRSVIPSVLPSFVGDWIRETCKHRQLLYRHMIPMMGPSCLHTEWKLNPDGTIVLELQDTNGWPFWWGTFTSEKYAYPVCDLGHPTRPDGLHLRPEDAGQHNSVPTT